MNARSERDFGGRLTRARRLLGDVDGLSELVDLCIHADRGPGDGATRKTDPVRGALRQADHELASGIEPLERFVNCIGECVTADPTGLREAFRTMPRCQACGQRGRLRARGLCSRCYREDRAA